MPRIAPNSTDAATKTISYNGTFNNNYLAGHTYVFFCAHKGYFPLPLSLARRMTPTRLAELSFTYSTYL